MQINQPKTRFLPIRSKSQILNTYEEYRHPSSQHHYNIHELFKYIKCPPNTFLNTTPAIFYTNKENMSYPYNNYNMMANISNMPNNTIYYHSKFLEHVQGTSPFMSTMIMYIYDDYLKHIKECHMVAFIYFPSLRRIHILDTANRTSVLYPIIAYVVYNTLRIDIKFVDVATSLAEHYDSTINLQEHEEDRYGYCTCWAAGIIEKIAPDIHKIEKMTWEEQLDFYADIYDYLIETPSFGKDFYNELAMRSNGYTYLNELNKGF
jgi:hypothetical protein